MRWKEWLAFAARTERKNTRIQRKPDIDLTTLQRRGNTKVVMRYVPVIIHIRGCYVNLRYDVTVVTSSYSYDVPLNETMNYLTAESCTPQTSTLVNQ